MIPYISRIFNVNVNRVAALYSTKSSQDKNEEPNGPNIKTEIPGPTSLSLLKKLKLYQDTENAEFFGNYEKSTGNYLVDADENVFLDLNMQHSRIPLGYNFKELTQVFSDPKSLHYITDTISMNAFPGTCCPSRIENIVDKVSPNLPNLYLCPCDSTAVEEGLKTIMSTYQNRLKEEESECGGDKGNTPNTVLGSQKLSILSFKNSQHGHTIGALNVSNADPWRKLDLAAFNWPVAYYPEYKYPLNEYVVYNAKQDRQSLAMIEDLIQKWQTKNQPIAGIIIEPLQNATNHVVSEHFLLDLEELTYKHGIYLMFDEIKTCCGATGKFWAHEHYCLNCPPDILTFGGKAQISGFLHRNDLKPLHTNRISPSGSMNVAKIVIFEAIIDFIEKRNLMRNVQLTGDLLRERLLDMEQRYIDLIHSTRGLGTVLAFDAHSSTIRDDLLRRLRKKGILCGKCGHQGVAIRPALTFNKRHADIFIVQLENTLKEIKPNTQKLSSTTFEKGISNFDLDKTTIIGTESKYDERKLIPINEQISSMSLKSKKSSKLVVLTLKSGKSIKSSGSGSGSTIWPKEPICVMNPSQFKPWPIILSSSKNETTKNCEPKNHKANMLLKKLSKGTLCSKVKHEQCKPKPYKISITKLICSKSKSEILVCSSNGKWSKEPKCSKDAVNKSSKPKWSKEPKCSNDAINKSSKPWPIKKDNSDIPSCSSECSKANKIKSSPEKLDVSYEKKTKSGSTNTIKSQCYNLSKCSKPSTTKKIKVNCYKCLSKSPKSKTKKLKVVCSECSGTSGKSCTCNSKSNKTRIVCSKCLSKRCTCSRTSKPKIQKLKIVCSECSGTVKSCSCIKDPRSVSKKTRVVCLKCSKNCTCSNKSSKSKKLIILCFKCLTKTSTKKIKILCFKCLQISKSPGPICMKCSKPKPVKIENKELKIDFNAGVMKLCPNKCLNKNRKKLCPRPWAKPTKSSKCVCPIPKTKDKDNKC